MTIMANLINKQSDSPNNADFSKNSRLSYTTEKGPRFQLITPQLEFVFSDFFVQQLSLPLNKGKKCEGRRLSSLTANIFQYFISRANLKGVVVLQMRTFLDSFF